MTPWRFSLLCLCVTGLATYAAEKDGWRGVGVVLVGVGTAYTLVEREEKR